VSVAGLKVTLERELKLGADPGFSLPELPGEALPARVFTSTYFDTDDRRLARYGVTLRRRVERSRGLWQLKLPRGVARLELEAPGGPAAPPAEMVRLLPAHLRRGELAPVAKLRTRRSGVRVARGGVPVADVTLDVVTVFVDGRVARSFREVEAELVDGSERGLHEIEEALRAAGARAGDARPKLFQALDLEPPPAPRAPKASAPAGEHLQAMLARQYAAIVAHDPGTRLGVEPEELHQMRVATRRLRAFLRAARSLLAPGWAEELRAEVAWLGAALGPVRDLDVLIEHLREDARSLGRGEQRALRRLFDHLAQEREEARALLLETLDSDRYIDVLDRLEVAVAEPRIVAEDVSLREIAETEFKRLRRAVRRLAPDPSDEALHDIRIRGKRARYAAELAEGSVGKPASRFVREAKAFQDVLGDHQDAVVAEERIRAVLAGRRGPALAFAAGRLVEREHARRIARRTAFPGAWKRLEKAGREAWG
jgi:CHAD domain-containing protein